LPISVLMAGLIDPNWWYDVVDAPATRELRCFAEGQKFNFNNALVPKADFEACLGRASIAPSSNLVEVSIAAQPAARVAGMSQGTVVSAINKGLLAADFEDRKWSIKLSDLKRFLDEFAHLGELSIGAIKHRPDLATVLRKSGLSPKARVTGATLWDRTELYAKLSEDPDLLPGVMLDRLTPAFPR